MAPARLSSSSTTTAARSSTSPLPPSPTPRAIGPITGGEEAYDRSDHVRSDSMMTTDRHLTRRPTSCVVAVAAGSVDVAHVRRCIVARSSTSRSSLSPDPLKYHIQRVCVHVFRHEGSAMDIIGKRELSQQGCHCPCCLLAHCQEDVRLGLYSDTRIVGSFFREPTI